MSIFNDSNSFRNVGIKNSNNELIVMNISTSSNNLSFHSSTSDNNVDIMNIKTILNKDSNNDLNLSSFDGSSINPVIQINNITQNVNISGNLNVTETLFTNKLGINTITVNTTDVVNINGNITIDGLIKQSSKSFILPTSSGILALKSDIPNIQVEEPLTISSDNIISLGNQDINGFITASSTNTLTNKSMSYGQITSRPFDIYYNVSVMTANYLSVFKSVSNRCILFSNSSLNYRHGIKHNDTNLEFYISTTNDGFTGTNLIYDISTAGLKLNVCDTTTTGNLLINSSGTTKKSVKSFTLPSTTGTLALTSDLSNFITASSTNTLTNKSMSYSQLTTPPISNDGLSNTKLIQFRNTGTPARCIEFANSTGRYRHTVEHTNTGLQFYTGNSGPEIGTVKIITISPAGLKIQQIQHIQDTDSFNVLMFNSTTGLVAKSKHNYIMPSTDGTLALQAEIDRIDAILTRNSII